MAITIGLVSADPAKLVINPVISVTSNSLKIGATTLKFNGVDAPLPETTYTATSREEDTSVEITIVRRVSDGGVLYLVDEIVNDGVDAGYHFGESPYVPLHYLAAFRVPSNVTDLSTCAINVIKTTPAEPTLPQGLLPPGMPPPN